MTTLYEVYHKLEVICFHLRFFLERSDETLKSIEHEFFIIWEVDVLALRGNGSSQFPASFFRAPDSIIPRKRRSSMDSEGSLSRSVSSKTCVLFHGSGKESFM